MEGKFNNIKIQGISTVVPQCIEDNAKYETVLGARRTKKQIKLTGVHRRHVAGKHQRPSDLCYVATTRLIDKLKWKKEDIKILIYITQSPNYNHPSTAFFLQTRLGLDKNCIVYDINLGCSSFNVGVQVVSSMLQQCNLHDKALLLLGDVAGKVRNPEGKLKADDIAHDMLFGAAGVAIGIEKVDNNELYYLNKSDGSGFDAIIGYKGRVPYLNGAKVFSFAINDVSADLNKFREKYNLSENSIDYYIFHQAQDLILDNIVDGCNIPYDKELRSLKEYGNTSGASVAVTICANREELCKKDKVKLLLCGFGVGLSWGYIYTEIDTENILPIIESNEHYDDDKKPCNKMQDKNIVVWDADSEMGEWLTRYNNDKSATVILAGYDENKLKEIQSDLFLESYSCVIRDNTTGVVDVLEFCKNSNLKVDGMVFPKEMQRKELDYMIKTIDQEYEQGDVSVVILEAVSALEKLSEKKANMELKIKNLTCEREGSRIRINGMIYVDEQQELVQIIHDGQEWIDTFLERGCPQSMKNPTYIAKTQEFLLSDNSKLITENVINLNG